MAQTQGLKRRIRSVRNAGQITKALEVVAAARMRKIQAQVAKSRSYGELADSIIRKVAPAIEAAHHPFFKGNGSKSKLYVVFSSDRGQAGAFNSNVFNVVHSSIKQDRANGLSPKVVVFGKKGASHFSRINDVQLIGAYTDVADAPDANFFAPIIETISDGFKNGEFGEVEIIYTQFLTSLNQQATSFNLLPVKLSDSGEQSKVYEFEPSIETVIDEALEIYFEAKITQARIESAASENAMRMVAMGNANKNATELIENLTLELNSLRQAAITQEIAEITGGAAAIAA